MCGKRPRHVVTFCHMYPCQELSLHYDLHGADFTENFRVTSKCIYTFYGFNFTRKKILKQESITIICHSVIHFECENIHLNVMWKRAMGFFLWMRKSEMWLESEIVSDCGK